MNLSKHIFLNIFTLIAAQGCESLKETCVREEDHFWSPAPNTAFSAAHSGLVGEHVIPKCAFSAGPGSQHDSMNLHGHDGLANTIDRHPFRAESFHSHFQGFVVFLIWYIEYHSLPPTPACCRQCCSSDPTLILPQPDSVEGGSGLTSWAQDLGTLDTKVPAVLWCTQPPGWFMPCWSPASYEPWLPRPGLDSLESC